MSSSGGRHHHVDWRDPGAVHIQLINGTHTSLRMNEPRFWPPLSEATLYPYPMPPAERVSALFFRWSER